MGLAARATVRCRCATPAPARSLVLPLVNGARVHAWSDVGRLLLTVEVTSPSTRRADREDKRTLYQEKAVPEYWVVDTAERVVERWRPDDATPERLEEVLRWQPDASIPALVIDLRAYFDRVHGVAG